MVLNVVLRLVPTRVKAAIAAAAARYHEQEQWLNSPFRKYTPWALADAARVCLAYGTEYNRTEASEQDLLQILNAYSRFEDPVVRDHDGRAFLLRMAGQQMTWQASEPQALARTAAIFTQPPLLKPAKYLRPGWESEVLGCTLQEYVGTAQLVWVSAVKCAGRFDLALFDTPDGKLIARHLSRDTVTRVLDTHFATSTAQFRAENKTAEGRAGRDNVGRQLRLLPGAQVLPEITYGPKSARSKTVDWIVVLPEVVLLVEVKSAIPTEPVRLGTPDAAGAIVGKLGKAIDQIDITAQLIADRDPALADVPADRPVLGLAVTLEPFHIANAFSLLPAGRTPVTVADAAEIEVLVTITDTPPGRLLLERAADDVRFTWSLDTALFGHEHSLNPILDEAWNSYVWASAGRADR